MTRISTFGGVRQIKSTKNPLQDLELAMAKSRKRKADTQSPNPPEQLIAKDLPPAVGEVSHFSLEHYAVQHVIGMDVDFRTPEVSAHGLATFGQPGPSFQTSSSISHELPSTFNLVTDVSFNECSPIILQLASVIQSHETTLPTDYPSGPPSAYSTSGAIPPMSEKVCLFFIIDYYYLRFRRRKARIVKSLLQHQPNRQVWLQRTISHNRKR